MHVDYSATTWGRLAPRDKCRHVAIYATLNSTAVEDTLRATRALFCDLTRILESPSLSEPSSDLLYVDRAALAAIWPLLTPNPLTEDLPVSCQTQPYAYSAFGSRTGLNPLRARIFTVDDITFLY